jgi:uncharacterized protein involved in exopolysaccharide biosynthesis
MKESSLYLSFLKRNVVLLLIPALAGLFAGLFFFATEKSLYNVSQTFKLEYNLENVEVAFNLTDQSVAELRKLQLGEGAHLNVYKSAPLSVTIESLSENRETAYSFLIDASGYLNRNFQVVELSRPEIKLVEPKPLKFLLAGGAVGILVGLILSLIKEYMKNY